MNNYKNQSLEQIIELAKNGDTFAISEIVKRYRGKIYNEFFAFNKNSNFSDMAQDTFLKITKSIKTLKKTDKFDAWLHCIIKNTITDSLRQIKKQNNYITNPIKDNFDFGECVIDERKTPDENALDCELKMKINDAISSLSPLLKSIIILREIEGLSYEEIAKLSGISVGTVKSRIARARIKLRKELEPYITGKE